MFDETHAKVFLQILNTLGDIDKSFRLKAGLFEYSLLLTQIELDQKKLTFDNITLIVDGGTIDQFISKEKSHRDSYIRDLINKKLIVEDEESFLIFLKKKRYSLKFHEKPKLKNPIVKAVCEMAKKGRLDHHLEEALFLYDFYKYNFLESVQGTVSTPSHIGV